MRCDGRGERPHQSVVTLCHACDAQRVRIVGASRQELLADDVGIRGLVTLDKAQSELSVLRADPSHPPQCLCERAVRLPFSIESSQHALEALGEVAHGTEAPALCTPPLAAHVNDAQVCQTRDRSGLHGLGMDELRAKFDRDRQPWIMMRPDPATDSIPRFEHHDIEAARDQLSRGGEASYTGTDDNDVGAFQSYLAEPLGQKSGTPTPCGTRPTCRASVERSSDR